MVVHQIAGTMLNLKPLTHKHTKKCVLGNLSKEKEFLLASFCVPFSQIKTIRYCFKRKITQHVVPAARTHANLTALFL
jgi:hypothetical protein